MHRQSARQESSSQTGDKKKLKNKKQEVESVRNIVEDDHREKWRVFVDNVKAFSGTCPRFMQAEKEQVMQAFRNAQISY